MKTFFAFALAALLLTQGSVSAKLANARPVLVSVPNIILTGKAAAKVLKQCSRNLPIHVTGYWTPTAADIKQLENDAPAFVNPQSNRLCYKWSELACQYAAYLQGGRKMIHVNCASRDFITLSQQQGHIGRLKGPDWQSTAFVFGDGSPLFFSMEYDVQARTFRCLRSH